MALSCTAEKTVSRTRVWRASRSAVCKVLIGGVEQNNVEEQEWLTVVIRGAHHVDRNRSACPNCLEDRLEHRIVRDFASPRLIPLWRFIVVAMRG